MKRHLGVADAAALFVGIILGSGIFVAPATVAGAVASPGAAALLWLTGGVVCLAGATTYAECARRLPFSGGFFVFYREAFGPALAFVGGWTALAITYPASIAAIALVFAAYAGPLFGLAPSPWLAAGAVVLAALVNVAGLRTGPAVQKSLTAAKVAALAALCAAAWLRAPAPPPPAADLPLDAAAVFGAMLLVLWTYDGWSDVTLVAGEVRDPGRGLARAIVLGVAVLAAVYVLVQVATLRLLPAGLAAASSRPVAEAVEAGLGPRAGSFVGALVALSTFGAIQAAVFTTSRLGYAMAHGEAFPAWFGGLHPRFGTPARATSVVASAIVLYVFAAPFRDLVGYFTFAVWIFYGTTAFALLRLRRRGTGGTAPEGPAVAAPYVVFAVGAVVTASLTAQDPKRAAIGLAMLSAGFPLYALWRLAVSRPSAPPPAPPR
ncbi:MAG TPA: amino acid permease [Candidatus Polarisedimenticolaceae bacterium]